MRIFRFMNKTSRNGTEPQRCFLLLILLFIFLSGCSAYERLEERNLVIESSGGRITLRAEIARTQEEQRQGYMHRQSIKDGEGMLFFNESDRVLSFWMRDTHVPLSIAFISSDGRILEIYDMEPLSLESVHSSRSVRHALEVPQGWFNRAGVRIGDRLLLEGL